MRLDAIEITIEVIGNTYFLGEIPLERGTHAWLIPGEWNVGALFLVTISGKEVLIPPSGLPIFNTEDVRVRGRIVGDKFHLLFRAAEEHKKSEAVKEASKILGKQVPQY